MQSANKTIFTHLKLLYPRKLTSSKLPKTKTGVANPIYTHHMKRFALQITLKTNYELQQDQRLKQVSMLSTGDIICSCS
jgi:hypothetical protein